MGSRRPGGDATQVLRNRANQISGWVLWVMLTGLWCLNDPMGLAPSHPPTATRGEAVLVSVCFAAASVLAVLVFSVPYVKVGSNRVLVQNPLSCHVLSRGLIVAVREGVMWPVLVLADGRRIWLVAAEQSALMRMRGVAVFDERHLQPSGSAGVVSAPLERARVWSVPVPARVVAGVWGGLVVLGLLFGRFV
ncbi:hypothetical protein AB2L28_05965 [Kineococcus sp. TBRC 1896]|uniref:PH (Pleckstrin Homology) domain-containing protein n=1 Tax=Kineococcus mangrovi TaxID=1660183 RepID=A0ABV4HZC8_9ACTN